MIYHTSSPIHIPPTQTEMDLLSPHQIERLRLLFLSLTSSSSSSSLIKNTYDDNNITGRNINALQMGEIIRQFGGAVTDFDVQDIIAEIGEKKREEEGMKEEEEGRGKGRRRDKGEEKKTEREREKQEAKESDINQALVRLFISFSYDMCFTFFFFSPSFPIYT